MWPFSWFRREKPNPFEHPPLPAGIEFPPPLLDGHRFGGKPADASLEAALARVAAIEWGYQPLPSETQFRREAAERQRAGPWLHPLAGRLLTEAHDAVRAVDARAFPLALVGWQWDDAFEAAFLTLAYARLAMTGLLEDVGAACAAVDGNGLGLPEAPLIEHVEALRAYEALRDEAAQADLYDGPPAEGPAVEDAARWRVLVHAYTRFLCYTQHVQRFTSPLGERVDRVERRLRMQDEAADERHTFGEGSF